MSDGTLTYVKGKGPANDDLGDGSHLIMHPAGSQPAEADPHATTQSQDAPQGQLPSLPTLRLGDLSYKIGRINHARSFRRALLDALKMHGILLGKQDIEARISFTNIREAAFALLGPGINPTMVRPYWKGPESTFWKGVHLRTPAESISCYNRYSFLLPQAGFNSHIFNNGAEAAAYTRTLPEHDVLPANYISPPNIDAFTALEQAWLVPIQHPRQDLTLPIGPARPLDKDLVAASRVEIQRALQRLEDFIKSWEMFTQQIRDRIPFSPPLTS